VGDLYVEFDYSITLSRWRHGLKSRWGYQRARLRALGRAFEAPRKRDVVMCEDGLQPPPNLLAPELNLEFTMLTPATFRRFTATAFAMVVLATAACSSGDNVTADDVPAESATGVFSALTYNVAGLPQALSGSDPEQYMPLIGPLLNAYELVLTQEDFANPVPNDTPFQFFHEVLRSLTDHEYVPEAMVAPMGSNPDRPTALASDGLNMFSRFPVGPLTRVPWTQCFGGADTSDKGAGDCLAVKGFTMAPVTLADGVVIDVYNLHGEAGSTPADDEAARLGYLQLAAFINERSSGNAILLGGDTNLSASKPVDAAVWADFLESTGLTDICDAVECPDEAGSIDKFAFRSSAAVTLEPTSRVVEYERFAAPGNPELNEGQLSDHRAISSAWRWVSLLG